MMSDYGLVCKEYFRALKNGALIGSRCNDCGSHFLPQRRICPRCHSEKCKVISFSGKGELVAYTVIFVPPMMMAVEGYSAKNPYCVGIVELEEGPRIAAQILDIDVKHPEKILIGTKLLLKSITRGKGTGQETFPAFQATHTMA